MIACIIILFILTIAEGVAIGLVMWLNHSYHDGLFRNIRALHNRQHRFQHETDTMDKKLRDLESQVMRLDEWTHGQS